MIRWWPNWYVTRLHAVNGTPEVIHGSTWARAVCMQDVRPIEELSGEWQQRRFVVGVPKCKNCERRLAVSDSSHA